MRVLECHPTVMVDDAMGRIADLPAQARWALEAAPVSIFEFDKQTPALTPWSRNPAA